MVQIEYRIKMAPPQVVRAPTGRRCYRCHKAKANWEVSRPGLVADLLAVYVCDECLRVIRELCKHDWNGVACRKCGKDRQQ